MGSLAFGLFDHLDRNQAPLTQIYEERLQLLEMADVAGFYGYHLAEHHMTPLGMAPSPGIFLSAVAQLHETAAFWPACLSLAALQSASLD